MKVNAFFRLQPVADPAAVGAGRARKTIAAFAPEGSTAYEWFESSPPLHCDSGRRLVAIYGLGDASGDAERQSDGNLRPRAAFWRALFAGDWRRRVFKQVLVDSGVGPALGGVNRYDRRLPLPRFVLAAAVRIIQGSATVACLTAVGLAMPVIGAKQFLRRADGRALICIGVFNCGFSR